MDEPALFIPLRYESATRGIIIDNGSLRRPDLVLRCTKFRAVVDERILSQPFELVTHPKRVLATLVLEGELRVETGSGDLVARPGEGVVHATELMARTRYDRTTTIELDWHSDASTEPRQLRTFDLERAWPIANELFAPVSQRELFARAFALLRDVGVPLEPRIDALEGVPTERDRRIGRAIAEQLQHLSSRATAFHLGDAAELSPRQLQRVVREFNARYGLDAGNWRDLRNRWRVKVAIVLLGIPELAIETIAREVGYASASALARAMAGLGLPPPVELRERLQSKSTTTGA